MNGLYLMPPHESAIFNEGQAKKIARRNDRLGLAGLNAPGRFRMKAHLRKPKARAAAMAPSVETFRFCILLVSFKDKPVQVPVQSFAELLFVADGAKQSVTDYYFGQSFSQLRMVGDIIPVTLDQDYAYYVNGNYGFGNYPRNAQGMVHDAVLKAGIDFSVYDNDGDGVIDGLGVIHAGTGAEMSSNPNDIWSHKWQIFPLDVQGGRVIEYYTAPEYWIKPGDMTIGVHCHEIAHVFGLADHYDTDGSSRGEDKGCVMAAGSWLGTIGDRPSSFCAHSLVQLGFVDPIVVTGIPKTRRLRWGDVYLIPAAQGEIQRYYLVEYRPRTGQDSAQRYGGVAIRRVNLSMSDNRHEWYPGKDATYMERVAIIPAADDWEMQKNQGGLDDGDFWPWTGHDSFTPDTAPTSNWPTGERTNVSIQVLSAPPLGEYADVTMGIMDTIGDANADGEVTPADLKMLIKAAFAGGEVTPGMDMDGDGFVTVIDVGLLCDKLISLGYTEDQILDGIRDAL